MHMQEARRAGVEKDSRPLNQLDFLLEVDDGNAIRSSASDGATLCQVEEYSMAAVRRSPKVGGPFWRLMTNHE
jgi:hypothetical protein